MEEDGGSKGYAGGWQSTLLNGLTSENKNTFKSLLNTYDDFKQHRAERKDKLPAESNKFSSCFNKFKDKVADSWNWDYWVNVQRKLINEGDSVCANLVSVGKNSPDPLALKFSEIPAANFIKIVEADSNISESVKSSVKQ